MTTAFLNRQLQWHQSGYWHLSPMPSPEELNEYYAATYWQQRGGKPVLINGRDLVHNIILTEYLPLFMSTSKTILNFGAGHGGLSHLLWAKGHNIINVEPSGLPFFYQERWLTVSDISEVSANSIDLVYGSHSLEHVQDIDSFLLTIQKIARPQSWVFWEVPNCSDARPGQTRSRLTPPHTYYFTTQFFQTTYPDIQLLGTFEQSHTEDIFQNWRTYQTEDDSGIVIRVLARIPT